MVTALALMATDGEHQEALTILREMSERTPPEADELDAAAIAHAAIVEAALMQGKDVMLP